jgi:hypothetical protein
MLILLNVALLEDELFRQDGEFFEELCEFNEQCPRKEAADDLAVGKDGAIDLDRELVLKGLREVSSDEMQTGSMV